MTFSGAWRTRAMGLSDQWAPLGAADSERHMTDFDTEAHGVNDTAVTRMLPTTPYSLDFPPPELIDATDSYAGSSQPYGNVPLDRGARDHGLSDDTRQGQGVSPQSVYPTTLHLRDRGSMAAREYDVPLLDQHDQTYQTKRFTPNTTTDRSRMQLIRGSNSYPENNPPDTVQRERGDPKAMESARVGWQGAPRPGLRVQRWSERKIPMHRMRYDMRPLWLHTAKTAGDSPALADGTGNQYRTPYDALVSMRQRVSLTPMTRRDPRAWDDSAVTDGTEEQPYEETYNSWGL